MKTFVFDLKDYTHLIMLPEYATELKCTLLFPLCWHNYTIWSIICTLSLELTLFLVALKWVLEQRFSTGVALGKPLPKKKKKKRWLKKCSLGYQNTVFPHKVLLISVFDHKTNKKTNQSIKQGHPNVHTFGPSPPVENHCYRAWVLIFSFLIPLSHP